MTLITRHQPASAGVRVHPYARGAKSRELRRPAVNITPLERGGRMIVGLVAAVAGVLLLLAAGSLLAATLEVLLIAAGVDLIVTGALGHCPLYHRFGYTPPSLRGRS